MAQFSNSPWTGSDKTFIDGNGQTLALLITGAGTAVSLVGVTVKNSNSLSGFSFGGAVYSSASLTMTDSVVSGNTASEGGGIYNDQGILTLTNCVLTGNSGGLAGGIFNNKGTVRLSDSTVNNNSSSEGGAGMFNFGGTVTITGSTISGNGTSGSGGGLWNVGIGLPGAILTLINSTVSDNTSGSDGGGIYNGFNSTFITEVNLNNVTIANNTSGLRNIGSGGGIFNNGGTVNVKNTILAGNRNLSGEDDCATCAWRIVISPGTGMSQCTSPHCMLFISKALLVPAKHRNEVFEPLRQFCKPVLHKAAANNQP